MKPTAQSGSRTFLIRRVMAMAMTASLGNTMRSKPIEENLDLFHICGIGKLLGMLSEAAHHTMLPVRVGKRCVASSRETLTRLNLSSLLPRAAWPLTGAVRERNGRNCMTDSTIPARGHPSERFPEASR